MPAPAEGAIQRTLQVDECSDWIIVLITIVTIAVITLVVGFQIGASRGGRWGRPTTSRVHNGNPVHTNPVHHLDDEKRVSFGRYRGLACSGFQRAAPRDYIAWLHNSAGNEYSSASPSDGRMPLIPSCQKCGGGN